MNAFRAPPKDVELVDPPPDSISRIAFSPTQDILAVASWNNEVRLYNVDSQGVSAGRTMYTHKNPAPILDITWSADGKYLFSAGCDNAAYMYDVQAGGEPRQVAAHDAPVKAVAYININTGILATGGWDKKLKYWNMQSDSPIGQVELSDRVYSMDTAGRLLVAATGDRKIHMFNLDRPFEIHRTIESPLKWQTRVVSCFPLGNGYAVGSIEGRVAIQHHNVDIAIPAQQPGMPYNDGGAFANEDKKNFSFKCHRIDITGTGSTLPGQQQQNVFAINTITFHREQETFCTGGSDGSLTFWDGNARTKLKPYSAKDLGNGDPEAKPNMILGTPIVSTSFNHNRSIIAYALSYDWSRGFTGNTPAMVTKVMLHQVKPEEVTRKPKTK